MNWPFLAVVRREMLTTLRSWRSFLLLALATGVNGVLFTAVFDEAGRRGRMMNTEPVLVAYMAVMLAAGGLIIPALAANAIQGERMRGSLDLVLVTQVRPLGLVLAKLVNVLGLYLLIVAASLPLLGMLFFAAGLDVPAVFLGLLVGLCAMTTLALWGLWISSRTARAMPAILLAYVGLVAQTGLPVLAVSLFVELFQAHYVFRGFDEELILLFAPLVASFIAALSSPTDDVVPGILLQLGLSAVLFFLCVRRIRKAQPLAGGGKTRKVIRDAGQLRKRRRSFPFYLIDPLRERPPIGDRQNPIFMKERFTALFSSPTARMRMFYLLLGLSLLAAGRLYVESLYGGAGTGRHALDRQMAQVLFVLTIPIHGLLPALVAGAFAREYESGNMDLLRSTLLRAREVVWGKLRGAAYLLAPMVYATWLGLSPILIAGLWAGSFAGGGFLLGAAAQCSALAQHVLLVMLITMLLRHTAQAIVAAYVGSFVIYLLPAFFAVLLRANDDLLLLFPIAPVQLMVALDSRHFFWGPCLAAITCAAISSGVLLLVITGLYKHYRMRDRDGRG